jgi:hypothetical protein
MLRYCLGMTILRWQTLQISPAMADRVWAYARTRLHTEMRRDDSDDLNT